MNSNGSKTVYHTSRASIQVFMDSMELKVYSASYLEPDFKPWMVSSNNHDGARLDLG